jgi:zinc transport system substrate-binding protein
MSVKKRCLCAVLCVCLLALLAAGAGCAPDKAEGVSIVATVFPAYDFVRELTRGIPGVSVSLLLPPGTESHTFDPSVSDALALADCSLLVYAGGDADPWVTKFLNSDALAGKPSAALCDAPFEALMIEGEDEVDPHIWTSPVNAIAIVEYLRAQLAPLLPASDVNTLDANCTAYTAELRELDNDFRTLAASLPAERRVLAFGDRYPFRYFCAEYGFTAYAVFPGCAEESEPAAADVKRVVDIIREQKLDSVYYVELSNHRIADAIAAETGCGTACLHSCHNLSKADFDAGENYLSLMRRNLEVLNAIAD